jgi:hypothetical protein
MPITFTCTNPQCGKKLSAKEELAGKRLRCPCCGTVQEVPPPEAEIVGRFFGTEAAPAERG